MAKKQAEVGAEAGGEKITKAEAVRRAIAEGVDKPQDAVEYIQKQFGLELTAQHFSSYKSQLKAKEGKPAGKRGRKARSGQESHGIVATPNGHDSMGGSPAALAKAVRALVSQHGAAAVKEMADVFGE